MPGLKFPMAAAHFLRSGISRNRVSSVAAKGFRRFAAGAFIFFIAWLAALLSRLAIS
jgi:predicted XRE-type DNA-binding protein